MNEKQETAARVLRAAAVFVPNCLTDLGGLWYDEQETQAQECDVRWNFQKS